MDIFKFVFTNFKIVSIIVENINVDTSVYEKKGIASVQHIIRPFKLYSYEPSNQTPKLVTTKKINAPIRAPLILFINPTLKYLEIKPMITTLPHVKKVNACKPIIRSVKKKLISKAGI